MVLVYPHAGRPCECRRGRPRRLPRTRDARLCPKKPSSTRSRSASRWRSASKGRPRCARCPCCETSLTAPPRSRVRGGCWWEMLTASSIRFTLRASCWPSSQARWRRTRLSTLFPARTGALNGWEPSVPSWLTGWPRYALWCMLSTPRSSVSRASCESTPQHQKDIIDILTGKVFDRDFEALFAHLATMCKLPSDAYPAAMEKTV